MDGGMFSPSRAEYDKRKIYVVNITSTIRCMKRKFILVLTRLRKIIKLHIHLYWAKKPPEYTILHMQNERNCVCQDGLILR